MGQTDVERWQKALDMKRAEMNRQMEAAGYGPSIDKIAQPPRAPSAWRWIGRDPVIVWAMIAGVILLLGLLSTWWAASHATNGRGDVDPRAAIGQAPLV